MILGMHIMGYAYLICTRTQVLYIYPIWTRTIGHIYSRYMYRVDTSNTHTQGYVYLIYTQDLHTQNICMVYIPYIISSRCPDTR